MIRQINRNFNVYDATKQGYKAELPELDFTKVQAREQARVNAEIARKQDLAKLQDTGLYNIFDSDVRRDVEALTKDVAEGRLDPKSQEYYNRYTSIGGKTKRYKTVSDQINKVYEEYNKNPEGFVWNAPDGSVYTGQEGITAWKESLNQESPEGMSFEEISTMAVEPARSLDTKVDLDTEVTQEYGKKLFENFAQSVGIKTDRLEDGEVIIISDDKVISEGQRNALKARLAQDFAKPLSQSYGIMQAQGQLPRDANGKQISFNEFALEFADKQIPRIQSKTDYKAGQSYATKANLNARTRGLNQENNVEIPPTTYGIKGMSKELTSKDIAGMPLAKVLDIKDGEEVTFNQQEIPNDIETLVKGTEAKIGGAVYNTKEGTFTVYGVQPDPDSRTVTRDLYETVEVAGVPAQKKTGSTVDYEKTKTVPFVKEVNKNDYISFLMKGKYTRAQATQMANELEAQQQKGAKQQGGNTDKKKGGDDSYAYKTYTKDENLGIEAVMKDNNITSQEAIDALRDAGKLK